MQNGICFDLVARGPRGPLLSRIALAILVSGACLGEHGFAQEAAAKVSPAQAKASKMRERITDEQLKAMRQDAPSTFDKSKAKPVDKVEAPVKANIYQISDVLVDGAFHTVVPKGAILSVPESLANRMAEGAVGKFQFWPDFYLRNKGWIRLQEVDVDVAKGKAPLPEGVIKMLETEPKMVIAVYKGNLITVLEAPPEEEVAEKGEKKK